MLDTIESRFGAQLLRELQLMASDGRIDMPTAQRIAMSFHLWPFFLHLPPGQEFFFPRGVAASPTVAVRANWGVWQTQCPFCRSAQHASKADPFFFCASCCNTQVHGHSLRVIWPGADTAKQIEDLLMERPFVSARNWESGEAVSYLKRENEAQENLGTSVI